MHSVEHTVRMLQREILAALIADAPLPGGVSLVADRVTVSLGLQFHTIEEVGGQPARLVVATGPALCAHHLTFEFKMQPAPRTTCAAGEGTTQPATPAAAEPPHFTALAEVFGVPGFDSSARATVFRETLEELDETQRQSVLASLGSPGVAGEAPGLSRARQLLQRLAGSGPAGPQHGPELLRQLAAQAPVALLLQLAAERWRTQSEWAAAGTPT